MANTINFILTNAALELIPKILNGKTLKFTRMAVGDGFSYDENVAKGFTTLVSEVLSIDITKNEILTPSSVRITSAFKNTDAQKEFYYREVGLFAQDPDTGQEVLYAYGNRNDAAELIMPNGSSVVSKQLNFIIAVGNSANVTFNVNADVYALQSDMEDVQTDINQAQSDIKEVQNNIASLQTNKANKDLNNTGMITNCLLEVPQRIKYSLSGEGVLTIKAGSVAIVPYGNEAPTFKVGDIFLNENFRVKDIQFENNQLIYWVELQSDITIIAGKTEDTSIRTVGINITSNSVYWTDNATAGAGEPSVLHEVRYATDLNFVKIYGDTTLVNSLPIMTVKANGVVIASSVPQVFQGMGYMGSAVWVDKGVKGLIPNGRNDDGSLNNIETTSNNLYLLDLTIQNSFYLRFLSDGTVGGWGADYHEGNMPLSGSLNMLWFDTVNNYVKFSEDSGETWKITPWMIAGKLNKESAENISSLKLNDVFRVANAEEVEGNWVKTNKILEDGIEVPGTDITYYDLSDLLPDSVNIYELLVEVICSTGATNGDRSAVYITSDVMTSSCVCMAVNSGGIQGTTVNTVLFPVRGRIGIFNSTYGTTGARNFAVKGYKRSK